ncbi:MAG: ECF transporter S component [Oscillospiraceae bacterium]|nr:ECF transporter S component [Oscillospiraceae bacterium]
MRKMSVVKRICICAVCIALCYILPMAFHAFGMGSVFLPMHIPVLLCGLLCGWPFGAVCGLVGPLLSSALSGMPPATALVSMLPELCVYGAVSGLTLRLVRTRRTFADLYIALVTAMVAGRIVGGIAKALFFSAQGNRLSMAVWASGYFVEGLPGIIIQLLVIPVLVFALTKARLVPERYPRQQN